jgi:hypothetical protein
MEWVDNLPRNMHGPTVIEEKGPTRDEESNTRRNQEGAGPNTGVHRSVFGVH